MSKRRQLQPRKADEREPELAPPIVEEALSAPGRPLDDETRGFMEPRFGHDFSRVRVHTDARAAESAEAVSALAYTVGQDIVFGAGQYQPGTSEGRRLLAHELAHTVQQERGRSLGGSLLREALERDAVQAASGVMQGSGPIHVAESSGAALARQPHPNRTEANDSSPGRIQLPTVYIFAGWKQTNLQITIRNHLGIPMRNYMFLVEFVDMFGNNLVYGENGMNWTRFAPLSTPGVLSLPHIDIPREGYLRLVGVASSERADGRSPGLIEGNLSYTRRGNTMRIVANQRGKDRSTEDTTVNSSGTSYSAGLSGEIAGVRLPVKIAPSLSSEESRSRSRSHSETVKQDPLPAGGLDLLLLE